MRKGALFVLTLVMSACSGSVASRAPQAQSHVYPPAADARAGERTEDDVSRPSLAFGHTPLPSDDVAASHHGGMWLASRAQPSSGGAAADHNLGEVGFDAEPGPAIVSEPPPRTATAGDAAVKPAKPPSGGVLALSDVQLKERVRHDIASLGSISVGKTNGGALVNGVRMPAGDNWLLMDPGNTWGTEETVDFLRAVLDKVARQHPGTHKVRLGHISAKRGGHLNPHKSHQSGRDVDVGYYYRGSSKVRWYRRANAKNLDAKRTWALVRALVTDTDVEYIFINSSIQKLLKAHALASGENRKWLDSLFQFKSKHPSPIIRHVRGHDTHLHVRFYNPVAQQLGVRAHSALARRGIIKPATHYVRHRARRGDLLGNLAKRYGCTVAAIRKLNRLRNNRIRAGRTYLIPKKVKRHVRRPPPLSIPTRRLPPERATMATTPSGQARGAKNE